MANTRYGQVRYGVARYWPDGPDTTEDYFDQPYWMRDRGGEAIDPEEAHRDTVRFVRFVEREIGSGRLGSGMRCRS